MPVNATGLELNQCFDFQACGLASPDVAIAQMND